ncbi:hypothetical protein TAMA11512_16780 [Selenomonas sp. TAMA-11512]|nr:hypothetical protein TAMA11512_16780 [Selenomonas sp. TAMA-11512]
MKRMNVLFTVFLCLAFAWISFYSTSEAATRRVHVSTASELMRAIASDTEIHVEPGYYNLTEWRKAHPHTGLKKYAEYPTDRRENPPGVYGAGYRGNYVTLLKIENLSIINADPSRTVEIVIEEGAPDVLDFMYCRNILLDGITLGHAVEPGYCDGDVVMLYGTDNFTMRNCDLYGCGVYGICSMYSKNTRIEDCTIRACSDGAVWVKDGNLLLKDTLLKDMPSFSRTILLGEHSEVTLKGCTFRNVPSNVKNGTYKKEI